MPARGREAQGHKDRSEGKRGRALLWLGACLVLGASLPSSGRAESLLPLSAEAPPTLASGNAEVVLAASYLRDMRWPAFTPAGSLRHQGLLQAPQLGFRIGAGGWAEIQASFEMLYLDEKDADGETRRHFGNGDARLATKVHIVEERRFVPALGVQFGTKLPNANRANRLGTDDTDFWMTALASKGFEGVEAHANLGILLLGNSGSTLGTKFNAGGQDDLFTYTLALSSKPWILGDSPDLSVRGLAEVSGWSGSRYDNDRAGGRVGAQLRYGAATFYAGTSFGFVTANENFGASLGCIYRFDPSAWFRSEPSPAPGS